MAGQSNFYFNNFFSSGEQTLLEDLIVESIGIHGHDVFYIPRTLNNYDPIYGADDQSSYDKAIPLVMYIESYSGFQGDGNLFSKFGLEIRDQVIFSVSRRDYASEVTNVTKTKRPNEGDLIYFPLNKKCYKIMFVEQFSMFYQLGKLYTWKLTTELFEYSDEKFNTGIPEIDSIQIRTDTNVLSWGVLTEDGLYLTDENGNYLIQEDSSADDLIPGDDSIEIQKEGEQFIDFSVQDPFSQGNI